MKNTLLVLGMLAAVATGAAQTVITVKGSDTMVILAQRWAERYMTAHPDVAVQVTGGGSGTGISALINGTTDICNSSRPMKKSERDKLKQRYGSLGVEIRCAQDGLSVYANSANPVAELSLPQVREIFTGRITNWKQVGGPDQRIILYSRENNSGTYVYFKDNVLEGEDFAPTAQNLPGTASVVNAVAKDAWGIGYGGAAYGRGIRELKLRTTADDPAYPPTKETIRNGTYPIARYLYMYLRNRPAGAIKQYVDWILGAEGQEVVSEVGYFPIR